MSIFDGATRTAKFNATRIRDYDLLGQYVTAWRESRGHHSLVVVGRPGILKSSLVKSAFPNGDSECLYVEGFTGPLALYRDMFLKLDLPVILDDIKITEHLRPILQPLWDNYDQHTIRWATAKPPKVYVDGHNDDEIAVEEKAEEDDENFKPSDGKGDGGSITLPGHFKTRSQCCVLTNSVDRLSNMPALLDRAYIIEFDPPVSDVLDRCRPFVDPKVWEWAKRHELLLPALSVRDLVQAGRDKEIGMPWETVLRGRYLDPKSHLGAYLEVISKAASGAERVELWTKTTGHDRATFFRVQREYREVFPTKNLPRGRSAILRLRKGSAKSQKRSIFAKEAEAAPSKGSFTSERIELPRRAK